MNTAGEPQVRLSLRKRRGPTAARIGRAVLRLHRKRRLDAHKHAHKAHDDNQDVGRGGERAEGGAARVLIEGHWKDDDDCPMKPKAHGKTVVGDERPSFIIIDTTCAKRIAGDDWATFPDISGVVVYTYDFKAHGEVIQLIQETVLHPTKTKKVI